MGRRPGFWSLDLRITRIAGFGDAGLVVGLFCTWVGLFGSLSWFLDLFAHFRWQYLACCLVAVPWFWWRRNRPLLVWAVLSLAVNIALISGLLLRSQYEVNPKSEPFLRAVSINVRTENQQADKVLDFIRQADADIVFVMEVDFWWEEALLPLQKIYPHHTVEPRVDNFGIAFFSRVEVQSADVRVFGKAFVPTLVATLKKGGRTFQVVGVHPVPPSGQENSGFRDEELRAYAALAANTAGPMLLVGDLNSSPWSNGMTLLTRGGHLRLSSAMSAAWPTWMVETLVSIPIDHALAKRPLTVKSRTIGPEVGSDHRPIVIEAGWLP